MPSAGYLPFLQSLACSLLTQNSCFSYPPDSYDSEAPIKVLVKSVNDIVAADDFQVYNIIGRSLAEKIGSLYNNPPSRTEVSRIKIDYIEKMLPKMLPL